MKPTTKTLAVLAALSIPASAAISVTTLNNVNTGQPTLDTSNGFLYAYNLGMGSSANGGAGTSVHQGVTFQDILTTGNHTTSSPPDTVDLSLYAGDAADTIQIITTSNSTNGFGSADLMGGDLFGSAIYSTNGTTQDIQITGLDNTKTYLVQFGGAENRNASWANFSFDVYVNGFDSGQDIAWGDGTNSPPQYGYGAVQFDGLSSIDIELQGGGPAFGFVTLSEVVIPEPSSVALLGGLLGAGLFIRRRR